MNLKNILCEVESLKANYERILKEKDLSFITNGDVILDSTYEMYLDKYESSLKIHLLEILLKDILSSEGYDEILKDLSLSSFLKLLNIDNSKYESDLENLEKILNHYSYHLNS